MKLQPFDIVLVKGKTPISKIVEYSTNSKYSHAALVVDDWHVVETDIFKPLRIYHFSYRLGEFDAFRLKTPLSLNQREEAISFIQRNLNADYDIMEAVSYWTYKLFGVGFDDSNKFICSGGIYHIFMAAHVEICKKNGVITPENFELSDKLYQIN